MVSSFRVRQRTPIALVAAAAFLAACGDALTPPSEPDPVRSQIDGRYLSTQLLGRAREYSRGCAFLASDRDGAVARVVRRPADLPFHLPHSTQGEAVGHVVTVVLKHHMLDAAVGVSCVVPDEVTHEALAAVVGASIGDARWQRVMMDLTRSASTSATVRHPLSPEVREVQPVSMRSSLH